MQRQGRIVLLLVAFVVMTVTGIAAARAYQDHQAMHQHQAAAEPVLLHVPPAAVIGPRRDFLGNAAGPYTLVEFADYQCPPCRAANQGLPALLAAHRNSLRFVFRNFPLSFHAYALPAADLGDANVRDLAQGLDVSRFDAARATTAGAAVSADVQEATALKLPGTPSFLLCCPDGRVVRLAGFSQVSRYCPADS